MNQKRRMLIVAGPSDFTSKTQRTFENRFEVLVERDVDKAKALLQNDESWHIVLVSLTLPSGRDGVAFLGEMAGHERIGEIPFVAIAQSHERHREVEARRLGAVGFFVQPVDMEALAAAVQSLLRLTGRRDTALIRREKEALRQRIVLDHLRTYVVELDYVSGRFYMDPAMSKEINCSRLKLEGLKLPNLSGIVYMPDLPKVAEALTFPDIAKNGEKRSVQEADVRVQTTKRIYEWFHVTACLLRDDQGRKERMIVSVTNIHEDMLNRRQLEYMASRDLLTKIPNRTAFATQTRKMLMEHPEVSFVVLRMDIERFRTVTQLFGSAEGDRILQYIAVKLQEAVESFVHGTYCRVSSDVFAACIPWEEESVRELVGYVQNAAAEYPMDYKMVLAFGLYVVDERDLPVNTMLDRAAQAQKTIKGSALHHEAFYDAALKKQDLEEQFILTQMNTALMENQFVVYFQPKCRMDTGEIVGAEALVRWKHPEKGVVPPSMFVPLFERNGFVARLDAYVWEHTCQMLRVWLDEGLPVKPVSVNVSRVDLYNPRLKEFIIALVKKYDLPKNLLELELTESAFVSDEMQMRNLSAELRQEGFRVLMDDFGSGYSSLNSLKDLSLDQIKLDLRFLETTENNEKSGRILMSVVRMARMLDLSVVAEGVETVEQSLFLQSIGCFIGQGYYFFRPMTAEDFAGLLREGVTGSAVGPESIVSSGALRALMTAEAESVALFDLLADSVGLYELTPEGLEMVRFNQGHTKLMGITREEGMRTSREVMEFVAPADQEEFRRKLEEAEAAEDGVSTLKLQTKTGKGMLWVRVQIRFLSHQDDKRFYLITMTDIAREKELEAQLEQRKQKGI